MSSTINCVYSKSSCHPSENAREGETVEQFVSRKFQEYPTASVIRLTWDVRGVPQPENWQTLWRREGEAPEMSVEQLYRRLGRLMAQAHQTHSFPLRVVVEGDKTRVLHLLKKYITSVNETSGQWNFSVVREKDTTYSITRSLVEMWMPDFNPKSHIADKIAGKSIRRA